MARPGRSVGVICAVAGALVVACGSGAPGEGAPTAPATNASEGTTAEPQPLRQTLATFEGTLDPKTNQMTIVFHPAPELTVLTYGTGANEVYFHTDTTTVAYQGACGANTVCGNVRAVNNLTASVANFTAVIDTISGTGVTTSTLPHNYGTVAAGATSTYFSWTFSDPGGTSFNFEGHAEGTVAGAGCADGTREWFSNGTTYTNIAGCTGGWSVAGINAASACSHVSGNSSTNPTGSGCAAVDLCASGWHICATDTEVGTKSSTGCTDATGAATSFFATGQSSNGNYTCSVGGTNDLFGCGTMGYTGVTNCSPLTVSGGDLCGSVPSGGWNCGSSNTNELNGVTKTGSGNGGVLCCL